MPTPESRIHALTLHGAHHSLARLRRGLEKESLRIQPDGWLAQTDHPRALGSALTHPYITTDFSEALLEFVTPAEDSPEAALAFLSDIHSYVYQHLGDELLWPASMPCRLGSDEQIPLARYGRSHSASLKTLYRQGLSHRYGRHMQTIAGIHYNFSLPDDFWPAYQQACGASGPLSDFITEAYFGLIRNFRRWSWLLVYLFGASPALCKSFVAGKAHVLQELPGGTLYAPRGTSLRMGDLGYRSGVQDQLGVSYNSLQAYVDGLRRGMRTPWHEYEAIGVRGPGGEYRQLSASILQIENEFYSSIRPKRVPRPGEPRLPALAARGVEYIEVRLVDLDPFVPEGLDLDQMRFLDTFLIGCLLADSPLLLAEEQREADGNMARVVAEGRAPGLMLQRAGQPVGLQAWSGELLAALGPVAALLDQLHGGNRHMAALRQQEEKLHHPELTPSARVMAAIEDAQSFFRFAMGRAEQHARYFRGRSLSPAREVLFGRLAGESLGEQDGIEARDTGDFDSYLAHYLTQSLDGAD